MRKLADNPLRLLRRLLGAPAPLRPPAVEAPAVMDGLAAVTGVERTICGDAVAAGPGDARPALAAAIGRTLAGERATAFGSGPDCLANQDLLAHAASLHLPLVVHLAARAVGAPGPALGSGHEAYHAAAERGLFLLFATNVQDAVDLAIIARRVAEQTLVPGLVAMDGEQTALACQEVDVPSDEVVHALLGAGHDRIDAPTDVQRLLFGPRRRRVPRGYDLERPMMLGALHGTESWGVGAAGQGPFFHDALAGAFADAVSALQTHTGRCCDTLHRTDEHAAELMLVAQGAAVETAMAVARSMHGRERRRVGVLGLRRLRPFPAAELAAALRGARTVAILERVDTPLAGEGPLTREVRAALARVGQTARGGGELPRLVCVPTGLGGLPLRAADLLALVRELATPTRTLVHLGIDFLRATPAAPKRQARTDALRRCRPELAQLGLRSGETIDVRPAGAQTIAIQRRAGGVDETLAASAAALLHAARGGFVRTRPGLAWPRYAAPCTDLLTIASSPLLDPGDDVPVDIVVLAAAGAATRPDALRGIRDGGAVLLMSAEAADAAALLPAALRAHVERRGLHVHLVPAEATEGDDTRIETLLGGLLALVTARTGTTLDVTRARAVREETLTALDEDERERRLEAFAAAFTALMRIELEPGAGAGPPERATRIPLAVRAMRRADDTVDCLASFWDRTGVLYATGATHELAADPHAAFGALPPLTGAFRDVSAAAAVLPIFDPASCDGDPRVWTSCPDGSLAALALTPRELLAAGIDLASAAGAPVDTLRSVATKLARSMTHVVTTSAAAPPDAGALLREAFERIMAKDAQPEPRRTALADALAHVEQQIGVLPVARTAALFDEPEQAAPGSGALLTLAVDPDTCRCPELLLEEGAGHGVISAPGTAEALTAARELWNLVTRLPDTSGETIERARQHPALGPLAALLLSRHCRQTLVGGDGAEAGSGARLALRSVLALAEHHAGPRLQRQLETITRLQERLAERIRDTLAAGLPTQDLAALADGLDVLGRQDVDLAELSTRVDAVVEGGRVDGGRLAQLVDAARELADLRWRLAAGPDGLGRARAGLIVAPGATAAWAGVHPYNPFACPVVIDASGETGALARGLLDGQLQEVLSGLRLIRWAQLLLDDPDAAETAADTLTRLRFEDLTDEERDACPPIVVVGDGRSFGGRDLGRLTWLLATRLPIKVLVLNGIGGAEVGEPFDLGLLAALGRRAFVVQTSPAYGDHFGHAVARALAFDGPAFVHVHAPSPETHGFPAARLLTQMRLAVASRAFPLFTFDPKAGGVFGACLDISANPDAAQAWTTDDAGRSLQPADWAATETRFAQGSAEVEERERFWRTLQELAGVVTPFTADVQQAAERAVAETHRAELERLAASYEEQLSAARAAFEREAATRVTAGLMTLAGYDAGDGGAS